MVDYLPFSTDIIGYIKEFWMIDSEMRCPTADLIREQLKVLDAVCDALPMAMESAVRLSTEVYAKRVAKADALVDGLLSRSCVDRWAEQPSYHKRERELLSAIESAGRAQERLAKRKRVENLVLTKIHCWKLFNSNRFKKYNPKIYSSIKDKAAVMAQVMMETME